MSSSRIEYTATARGLGGPEACMLAAAWPSVIVLALFKQAIEEESVQPPT